MSVLNIIPATPDATASQDDDAAVVACPACVHPWEAHDAIGVRYCTATIANALTRGCACALPD